LSLAATSKCQPNKLGCKSATTSARYSARLQPWHWAIVNYDESKRRNRRRKVDSDDENDNTYDEDDNTYDEDDAQVSQVSNEDDEEEDDDAQTNLEPVCKFAGKQPRVQNPDIAHWIALFCCRNRRLCVDTTLCVAWTQGCPVVKYLSVAL
jgi:hypothetical protein